MDKDIHIHIHLADGSEVSQVINGISQSDKIATRAEKHSPIAVSELAIDEKYQGKIRQTTDELYNKLWQKD